LKTLAAASTITLAGTKSSGRVLGANETIRVGVAGLNGRGGAHVGAYAGMNDVAITYLIDPDTRTFAKHLKRLQDRGDKPTCVQDVRKALDDKSLDVISIATTNHWHAPMTIWACQAGKDVYVEKPCSHNVHEGRIAVEVARKYGRIVQHGTQSRAGDSGARIAALARSGKLGRLLVSRGLCYKSRGSIGVKPPTPAPNELDFNIWLGPAPEQPHHGNLVHYNWHWFWDFGNGDIGNQGVHQMDIARWAIPDATLPTSVLSIGGRFGYTDQGQTPNTQIAIFDYGPTQLIFEVRGLKTDGYYEQKVGNTFHFEAGTIAGGKFYPRNSVRPSPCPASRSPRARGAAATSSVTSSTPPARASTPTSMPTSWKGITPAPSATWPTSPTAWGRRCRLTARPRPSATTRPPTRPSSAWRSTWPRGTASSSTAPSTASAVNSTSIPRPNASSATPKPTSS
jgi:hypothetical protein